MYSISTVLLEHPLPSEQLEKYIILQHINCTNVLIVLYLYIRNADLKAIKSIEKNKKCRFLCKINITGFTVTLQRPAHPPFVCQGSNRFVQLFGPQ